MYLWHEVTCAPTPTEASPSQLPLEFGYPVQNLRERGLWTPLCWVCLFGCVGSFPRINSPESQCEMLPYTQVSSRSIFSLPFIPFVFTVCDSSHEEQSCCLQIKCHTNELTRVENIWWSWYMLLNVNTIQNHLFNYCTLGYDDVKPKHYVIPLNSPSNKGKIKKTGSWFNVFVFMWRWRWRVGNKTSLMI